MFTLRLILTFCAACCASGCDAREADKPGAQAPPAGNPNPMTEKESRTAAQRKLDSHIVLALKKSRGEAPFDQPTSLDPDLAVEADGRVLVDLDAAVTGALLARIESTGGKIIASFEASHAIRALVPLAQMEALAGRADVKFISPAAQGTTNRGGAAQAQGSTIRP